MQSVCQWQAWRARFLPIAESIIRQGPAQRAAGHASSRVRGWLPRVRRHSTVPNHEDNTLEIIPAEERIHKFFRHGLDELYPRTERSDNAVTVYKFRTLNYVLKEGDSKEDEEYMVRGRISSIRSGSSKLFFFDIVQSGHKLQVVCSFARLPESKAVDKARFKARCNDLSRGDVISIRGHPYRTEKGELSIRATELPRLLSPCLQPFPIDEFDRSEKDKQGLVDADRHVQLLSVKNVMQTMLCRSAVIGSMRRFLLLEEFTEVDTPILGAVASGATARPFETSASEFPDRRLALRIAPELWLKRLVLGGLEKVFEIGPAFRNEGLDKTHNPEFTTCEFYKAHTSLHELMKMTEDMLRHIQNNIERKLSFTALPIPETPFFAGTFPRLEFIPSLENALGLRLPNLASPEAESTLLEIFNSKSLPIPSIPTVPRLLDKLSSIYLEPRCDRPTFIINHPECLSPLAKSFLNPQMNQKISARAELFIGGREIANMYEEENSPFEQRRKFEVQKAFSLRAKELSTASSDAAANEDALLENLEPDASYLEALEWGLPPTGGWGCGVDRLVMLFTGKDKIADVLPFGNLRAVTRGAGRETRTLEEKVE